MVIAKKFPRNQMEATDRILNACTRPSLAQGALYSYNRGGSDVTGPSIRLAEAIAQTWGNIQFGIRELEQSNGESTVEAFAWDLESNTRQSKIFQVPHIRYTRRGITRLEDPRDVYEMVANQGARRLRACILGVVPGDVIEAAVDQCEQTLKANADTSPESVNKMVEAFRKWGVSKDMIERRIGKRIEAINAAQLVQMKKIYQSLRDGMSDADDWFQKADGTPDRPDGKTNQQPTDSAPTWPEAFTDEETGEEGWVDSAGEYFDPTRHAMSDSGVPAVKQDGSFRARRGTVNRDDTPPAGGDDGDDDGNDDEGGEGVELE